MNTRTVMIASAALMGIVALACIFAPDELRASFTSFFSGSGGLSIQLIGAFYFAFATLNWMSRGTLLGGIYGRPIVIANLTHFVVAGIPFARQAVTHPQPEMIVLAGLYVVFIVLFSRILFISPKSF